MNASEFTDDRPFARRWGVRWQDGLGLVGRIGAREMKVVAGYG